MSFSDERTEGVNGKPGLCKSARMNLHELPIPIIECLT